MPFPIAAIIIGAANPSVVPYIAGTIGSVGWTTYCYFKGNQELPTFHTTAEKVVQSAREDIDALVSETSEHLHQVEIDTMQQNARIDDASTSYELKLITLEQGAIKLDEAVTMVVASREEYAGERQHAIETQVNTQSSLARQQSAVQSIAASLENLPELLQSNREKQALRVEHARLLLEKESYASRTGTLLDVIKEKNETNERLQAQVDTLEAKFSGLASQMESVLAFAQSKQREVDYLRAHLNEQGAESVCWF